MESEVEHSIDKQAKETMGLKVPRTEWRGISR